MPSCKYSGTFGDYSGYGDANRNFIIALYIAGVNTTTELVTQVPERASFAWQGELCKSLQERKIDYKIKIIHLTPDMYPRYQESGKYHIGHLFWETDKLPKEWIAPCNKMNEIWTASEQQAKMIKDSGVNVPVYWFPQPIDVSLAESSIPPYIIPNFSGLSFYSIFQWIERKNPKALITTFWKTFTGKQDVCLILKTYGNNYSEEQFNLIKDTVKSWKTELNLPHYPKTYLVKKLLDTTSVWRLHKTGGCYITTSRGEGWGRPIAEAMLIGKPVIGIDKTGIFDYVSKDHYYSCSTTFSKVKETPSIKWYTGDQSWLNISPTDLAEKMLSCYNNNKEAQERGNKAKEFVKENFSYLKVGNMMKDRLVEIEKLI